MLTTAVTVYMFSEWSVSRSTSAVSDLILFFFLCNRKVRGKFYTIFFFFVPMPGELLPSFSQFCLICFLLLPKVTYSRISPFFFVLPFLPLSLFLFQEVFYNEIISDVFFSVLLYFLVYDFK